jgi:SAM-dependent methyltransferase
MGIDFNDYKDRYQKELQSAISFIGQDVDFFTEVKANYLLDVAKRHFGDLKKLRILDVGCGIGLTDSFLTSSFGSLEGVDIAEGVVEKARQANPSGHYQVYDGKSLPFPDDNFDLVFAICVMEYLTPDKWEVFLNEMHRVTRKDGVVAIFQHNPLNPLTRLVLNRCEYDSPHQQVSHSQMKKLFKRMGLSLVDDRFILFFPWRGKIFRNLEYRLGWFPLGAQYYIAGEK